jgi:hypothetical protein
MAEQYYAKKKYNLAQQVYEDIMPAFRGQPEFEIFTINTLIRLFISGII